jgi:hypothetical protein
MLQDIYWLAQSAAAWFGVINQLLGKAYAQDSGTQRTLVDADLLVWIVLGTTIALVYQVIDHA